MKNNNDKVCSFKIHNVKAFEEIVLPQYFKHSNMSSFVRQVLLSNAVKYVQFSQSPRRQEWVWVLALTIR